MDPLTTDISEMYGAVQIKEEIVSSEDEERENVHVSRSVEIHVNQDLTNTNKSLSTLEEILQISSCTHQADPLSEEITIDEIELKHETKWEDSEIDIIDNQLCYETTTSPFKEVESNWLQTDESPETHNMACNGYEQPLRRSSRKKNPIRNHPKYCVDKNEEVNEENLNCWSDNSDEDPDYVPVDDIENEKQLSAKCKKVKNRRYKNRTCTAKKYFNSRTKSKTKQKYKSKKNACFYCNRKYGKLLRHFRSVHSSEPDVHHMLTLEKGSKERCFAMKELIEKGNLHYNKETDKSCINKHTKIKSIKNSQKSLKPKRIYRKNVCLYCKKKVLSMAKHLQIAHSDVLEVQHFMGMEKGSRERKLAIQKIRNKGNFLHNKEVISSNNGCIIPCKQQKSQDNYEGYLPCNYCFGFYKKQLIYRHMQVCAVKKVSETQTSENDKMFDLSVDLSPMEIVQKLISHELEASEIKMGKKKAKRGACYFCHKFPTKYARHLIDFHSDEPEVKHIISLHKGSKERYFAIQAIRRKGNFVYNKTVFRNNKELMILNRNVNSTNTCTDFLPCEHCFGFFKLNTLFRHVNKCHFNRTPEELKQEELKCVSEGKRKRDTNYFCSSLMNCPDEKGESFVNTKSLLLKRNKIMALAKNDVLIVKYGALLSEKKKGVKRALKVSIPYKIRCLARLVIRINIIDKNISNLTESLKPQNIKTVIRAALNLCSATNITEKAISEEKSLMVAIKDCCMILKSDCLIKNNINKLNEINDFLTSMKEHWSKSLLEKTYEHSNFTSLQANDECDMSANKQTVQDNENSEEIVNDVDHFSSLVYTRKNYCLYCKKSYVKLLPHWTIIHSEEPEIIHLTKLDDNSLEKKVLSTAIRNKGNYLHNKSVIQGRNGFMVPTRGRATQDNYSDYLPCEHCLGFYKLKALTKHSNRCPLNPILKFGEKKIYKSNGKAFGLIALSVKNGTEILPKIILTMKVGKVKQLISQDNLIMKFGAYNAAKMKTKPNLYKDTAYKMRQLGLLVMDSRNIDNTVRTLQDCLHPKNFLCVLTATKERSLTKSKQKLGEMYFNSLRLLIRITCLIVKNESIIENNERKRRDIDEFLLLLRKEFFLTEQDKKLIGVTQLKATCNVKAPKGSKIKTIIKKWSTEELETISSFFSTYITNLQLPGKIDIEKCIRENDCLATRGWVSIKSKIRDILKIESKKQSEQKRESNSSVAYNMHTVTVESKENTSNVTESKINNKERDINSATRTNKEKENQWISEEELDFCLNQLSCSNVQTAETSNKVTENYDQITHLPCNETPLMLTDTCKKDSRPNCDNESQQEERTYLLLGACDLPQNITQDKGNNIINSCGTEKYSSNIESENKTGSIKPNNEICHQNYHHNFRKPLPYDDNLKKLSKDKHIGEANNNKILSKFSCKNVKLSNKSNDNKKDKVKKKCMKREWTEEENEAIIEFFKDNLKRGKIPSKYESEDCIKENECLESRDWISVKSKVYNLIVLSKKRKRNSQITNNNNEKNKTTGDQITLKSNFETNKDNDISNKNLKRKKYTEKRQWSTEENQAIENFFSKHIQEKIVPGKRDCEKCIGLYSCLTERSWITVKSKVHNLITSKKRRLSA